MSVDEKSTVERVKVWPVPVRLIHWLLVADIVVLSVTGLYIGTPALATGSGPALVMSWARAIHIGSGFVLIALVLGRVIYMFTGPRYARWDQFLPVRRAQRSQLWPSLRFYLFLTREPPVVVGHNPLAGATYTVVFAMLAVEALTGLALYAQQAPGGWAWTLTGWLYTLLPAGLVRLVHHLITWLIWGFVVHHVYSATLMDHVEKAGVISSMISGWKSVPKDRR
jgi:Ni/Fe-hydrogenase 1 B-type cytochrome subunit